MKKVVLSLFVMVVMVLIIAQGSLASSLISLDDNNTATDGSTTGTTTGESTLGGSTATDGSTTGTTTGESTLGGSTTTNNDNNDSDLILGGTSSDDKNSSFSYEDEADEDLPQTGLNNTGLVVLTVIALGSAVIAFKKISDYGNI